MGDLLAIIRGAERRLFTRLLLLIAFVAFFGCGALLLVSYDLKRDADGPVVVNTAGRQRMLTKRAVASVLLAELRARGSGPRTPVTSPAAQATLDTLLERHQWLTSQAESLSKNGSPGPLAAIRGVTPLLQEFEAALAASVEAAATEQGVRESMDRLDMGSTRLIAALEVLVTEFDNAYSARIDALRQNAQWIAGLGALSLVVTVLFLFWPSVHETRAAVDALHSAHRHSLRQQAELQAITDQAPTGIFRTDADGHCTFVNAKYTEITGLSDGAARGLGWRVVIHPDDLDEVSARWGACAAAGTPFEMDFRVRRLDGSVREVHASSHPVHGDGNAVVGHVGVLQDLTSERALHRTLEELAVFREALLDGAGYAVIAADPDGIIRVFNRAAEELLGRSASDVIGKVRPSLWHDEGEVIDRAKALSMELERVVRPGLETFTIKTRDGGTDRQEWTYLHVDGTRIPVELTMTAMHAADGRLVGFLGIARDLRAEKTHEEQRLLHLESLRIAERRATESARLKAEFVANMSHEIRTPMNAILGFTDLVLMTELDEMQRDSLETARRAADHLLALINDILDFSKIEAGQMRVERIPFDLGTVVEEVGTMLRARAEAKDLSLRVDVPEALRTTMEGDPVRVRQVLVNFVGNAVKFTHEGGVVLRARHAGGRSVRLEVQDTGIGIAPEALDRVFDQFSQADASTTRRFGGTGLGLAIARQLAELMGGEVGVSSTVGVGSVFWCELPLLEGAAPLRQLKQA